MTKTLQIDGQSIEYELRGEGTPCIVLLSGEGLPLQSWNKAVDQIDDLGTILTYNRLGIGKSSKPTSIQSGDVVASTLQRLLHGLDLKAPYLLVGHSSGGLLANLYARLHSDETCGVVLIESAHPDQVERLEGHFSLIARGFQWMANRKPNRDFHASEETADLIRRSGTFPEVPLIVVTGSKKMPINRESAFAIHQSNQKELVQLNCFGEHIIAEKSGHLPQVTEPDVVANAIRSTAQRVAAL